MPDINEKYSYVAKCCQQRVDIFNFVVMINAMVSFIWEVQDSFSANAQMPINVVYKILWICNVFQNIRRIHGVEIIPKIQSLFAKITVSQLQILVILRVIRA